jgi:alginate O-acetyltransferase complex protein AlgI
VLFNSLDFGLAMVVTITLWSLVRGRARIFVLLLSSYLLYAGWNPWFVLLLAFSTVLDYLVGLGIERVGQDAEVRWKRLGLLLLSLGGNLGVLFFFKYRLFFFATVGLADWSVVDPSGGFHVYGSIPPGLSFYTFQTLSYTIDVYRGQARACRNPIDFALFVSFFPQLVAGPILRSSEFLPQLRHLPPPSARATLQAVELFTLGLFKKVVIADNLGGVVDRVFAAPEAHTWSALAIGGLLFWIQIYCDFSAYSTMARGLGRLFGFDLPKNFDYPILASNPLEYRRAWHRTMSAWFRDYVFHPLGGTRRGPVRTALNIMIVWALFGLWHGAAWTFVIWGLYNGVIQVVYREMVRRGWTVPDFPGKRWAGTAVNVLLFVPSAVAFRSATTADALVSLKRLALLSGDGASLPVFWLAVLGLLFAVHVLSYLYYDEDLLSRLSWPSRLAVLGGAALLILLLAPPDRPFIYFQF